MLDRKEYQLRWTNLNDSEYHKERQVKIVGPLNEIDGPHLLLTRGTSLYCRDSRNFKLKVIDDR